MATPVYARPGRNPYYALGQRGYLAPFIAEEPAPAPGGLGGEQTQGVQTPVQVKYASPQDLWRQEYGGGSERAGTATESQSVGTLAPSQRSTLSTIGGLGSLASLAGAPFVGGLTTPVRAVLGFDTVAKMLGVPTASITSPYAGLLTPEAIQELGYYDPNAAARAQASRDAVAAQMADEASKMRGYEAGLFGVNTGEAPGGPGMGDSGPMQSQHEAESGSGYDGGPDSTAGADPGEGYGGWGGLDSSGGGGGIGGGDAGGGIGSGEGGGGAWARGGVSRATRGPKRGTWGEAGDETAIFIPRRMRHPGMQGREREVRGALAREYGALQPRGFAKLRPGNRRRVREARSR